jgi:protein arginine kinase activator
MNKCDLCNKPAVVHEVTVKNGIKKEVHLCQEHAAEIGIELPDHQPITQLLTKFTISHTVAPGSGSGAAGTAEASGASGGAGERRQPRVCAECGLSFTDFRKKGTLGCPSCYEAFEQLLAPLIERAQNGATHHAGKAPRRAGSSLDRQLCIQRLLKELDSAVAAEQYERAAELRDQINSLEIVAPADPRPETA